MFLLVKCCLSATEFEIHPSILKNYFHFSVRNVWMQQLSRECMYTGQQWVSWLNVKDIGYVWVGQMMGKNSGVYAEP